MSVEFTANATAVDAMTDKIYDMVAPYTMVSKVGVEFTAWAATVSIASNVPGDLVECGTWKGGCGLAMLLAQREAFGTVKRKVHFFDSFKGLPKAVPEIDGPAAVAWQAQTEDNCLASRADLEMVLKNFDFKPDDYRIWEGWFAETLHRFKEPIALLRIDCDWYRAVSQCLRSLMPLTSKGATVIIDDYYAWDGCVLATHKFLADSATPYRLRSLSDFSAVYFTT